MRVTSKGQVTIPANIRARLRIRTGDEVTIVETPYGFVLRKVIDPAVFEKWRGYLKHLEGRDSVEIVREMRGE